MQDSLLYVLDVPRNPDEVVDSHIKLSIQWAGRGL